VKVLRTRTKFVLVLLTLTTMLGCGALDAGRPAVQQSSGLVASSPALDFGTVLVGDTAARTNSIVNNTNADIVLTHAEIDHTDFRISGQKLPLRLAPGERTTMQIVYSPQSDGGSEGKVVLGSNTIKSSTTFLLKGTAIASGRINLTPTSIRFGGVPVGKTQTQSAILSNSGSRTVTIGHVAISGQGFALTEPSFPLTLKPGQNTKIGVAFTPVSGGVNSGTISLIGSVSVNDTRRPRTRIRDTATDIDVNFTPMPTMLNVPVSGTGTGTATGKPVAIPPGATAGVLSTSDSSLNFGSVPVKGSATQSETLTNTGGSRVKVTQANVSGAAFRVTGLNLPLTLNPRESFTFGAVFAPTPGSSATGSISIVSDASNSTLTISLAGTATVPGHLVVSPATLSFDNVPVGQTKSLPATLTASGSSIEVSDASMTTSEFKVSGLSLPFTLAAGKSASFTVSFTPQASGMASASGSFTSNASNSAVQSLTGNGTPAPLHSVALSWNASTSSVVGYNVYRGTTTGGPYSKINAMNASTSYTDNSVVSGQTYSYVTTAVDGNGKESAYSNEVQAVVPGLSATNGAPTNGAPAASSGRTYTTNFPATANPISEGGNWTNGLTTGLDWSNISTTPGLAIGHEGSVIPYSDATAVLTGTWGPDQTVVATAFVVPPTRSCGQELELRLRTTISAHSIKGYEISYSSAFGGLIIVRWNGPVGSFAILASASVTVRNGDVMKATMVGNTIRTYKNGTLVLTATDGTYTSGSPGIGINLTYNPGCTSAESNNYGFTNFTAVSLK